MFLHLEVLLGINSVWLEKHELLLIIIELVIGLFLLLLFSAVSRYLSFNNSEAKIIFFNEISWQKLGITLGMFLIALLIGYLDDRYNPAAIPENQQLINQYYLQVPLLVSTSNYLFAPVVEEFLFRGLFFQLFFPKRTKRNDFLKILASGIVFGFAHQFTLDVNLLIYCSMGWVLGTTYYFTKELACPMLVHLLVNIV